MFAFLEREQARMQGLREAFRRSGFTSTVCQIVFLARTRAAAGLAAGAQTALAEPVAGARRVHAGLSGSSGVVLELVKKLTESGLLL